MLLMKKKVKKKAAKFRMCSQALIQDSLPHSLKYEVSGTGSSSLRHFMPNRIAAPMISITADKAVDTMIMSLFSCDMAIMSNIANKKGQ